MKTIKLFSTLLFSLFSFPMFAAYIPMPIFIPSGGGGGNLSEKDLFAVYLAFTFISLFIILVRAIIFFLANKKTDYTTFFDYVIWDRDYDYITPLVNTSCLLILNFIVFLVWFIDFISSFL